MNKLLLLCLLIAFPGYSHAQDRLAESLSTLTNTENDTAKVGQYCRLSQQYVLSDARKAVAHASAARELAARINFPEGKARALNLMGKALLVLGEYDKGLRAYLEALKIGEQLTDSVLMVDSYLGIGIMYHKINDLARAFRYCNAATTYAQKSGYTAGLARSFNSLGVLHQSKKEYRQALLYFQQAAELEEKLGDRQALGVALLNIGDLHLYLKEPAKGLPYLFEALRLNEVIGNKMIQTTTLKGISKLYLALGKHQEALEYGKRCYALALETESSKKIAEAAQFLQQLYASLGNYEQAYRFSTVYIEHNGLLDLEKQKQAAAEMTAKYETAKKELENQKLKAEKHSQALAIQLQQGMLLAGVFILLLMLGLVLVLFFSRKRLKAAHLKLQEVNSREQAKNLEINRQKDEIISQSQVLTMQNEQLAAHDRFKGRIFSIISHDLRAPFLSLKGVLQMVQRQSMSESQLKHIFTLLNKELEVSLNMLNNLLVWSKTQLNGDSLQLQPLALPPLIEENLQVVAPHAAAKKLSLIQEIAPHVIALADKERLNFILRNLLMNAIKFSSEGGEIIVKATAIANDVTIAVCDRGKGIPAASLPKLFTDQRYTTLGTAKEKGTGLGLMLCKELVESLHGSIAVESEEGNGSTFIVTLPKPTIQTNASSLGA